MTYLQAHVNVGENTGYESSEEALISYIIYVAAVAITAATLFSAIYHFFIKNTAESPSWTINISLMLSLSFNLVFTITTVVIATRNIFHPKPYGCVITSLNAPLIGIARLNLYFFYIARFYNVFDGTPMSIPQKTLILMIIGLCISVFGSLTAFMIGTALSNCKDSLWPRFVLMALSVAQDIFWSIVSWYMFYSRLKQVSRLIILNERANYSTRTISSGNINNYNSGRTRSNSKHRRNASMSNNYAMLKLSIKLAILTMVTGTATVLGVSGVLWTNPAVGITIDACINGICVMLSFTFNKKYYKLLCWPCRRCCEIPYFLRSDNEEPQTPQQLPHGTLAAPGGGRQSPLEENMSIEIIDPDSQSRSKSKSKNRKRNAQQTRLQRTMTVDFLHKKKVNLPSLNNSGSSKSSNSESDGDTKNMAKDHSNFNSGIKHNNSNNNNNNNNSNNHNYNNNSSNIVIITDTESNINSDAENNIDINININTNTNMDANDNNPKLSKIRNCSKNKDDEILRDVSRLQNLSSSSGFGHGHSSKEIQSFSPSPSPDDDDIADIDVGNIIVNDGDCDHDDNNVEFETKSSLELDNTQETTMSHRVQSYSADKNDGNVTS